jgi:hypothetical protein
MERGKGGLITMKRVKCAICGLVEKVNGDVDIDGLPDGWIVNEDDYTYRCDDWECQEADYIPDYDDYGEESEF